MMPMIERTEPRGGLRHLSTAPLPAALERALADAMRGAEGTPTWKRRKRAEARDLLALGHVAPPGRLTVLQLDVRQALRAVLRMDVPVARMPPDADSLVVERGVTLGVIYPEETLSKPLPGAAFVQILAPSDVWSANVAVGPVQALCLGASLPRAIPVKEIVLMSWGALSMQSTMIDPSDPAGVLNIEAARWWHANRERIPLTRTPFLRAEEG